MANPTFPDTGNAPQPIQPAPASPTASLSSWLGDWWNRDVSAELPKPSPSKPAVETAPQTVEWGARWIPTNAPDVVVADDPTLDGLKSDQPPGTIVEYELGFSQAHGYDRMFSWMANAPLKLQEGSPRFELIFMRLDYPYGRILVQVRLLKSAAIIGWAALASLGLAGVTFVLREARMFYADAKPAVEKAADNLTLGLLVLLAGILAGSGPND